MKRIFFHLLLHRLQVDIVYTIIVPLSLSLSLSSELILGCVCLEVKQGGQKILERKQEEKLFGLYLVGWRGRKINSGIQVFSLQTHQKVISKMERKLKGKIGHHFWTKMPMCNYTWACPRYSFYFSFFSFSFSFLLDVASSSFFFFFFIYWAGFLVPTHPVLILFIFFFFFFCFLLCFFVFVFVF